MTGHFSSVTAEGIELILDLRVGHIRTLRIEHDGRRIEPLHTAPWVDDPAITDDESIDPCLRYLSGDFFCAPFAANDLEPAPAHGWPANSPWHELGVERDGDAVTARFELERPVLGARITKELTLRDGHPFVYQRHVLSGGEGAVPVASHAITRFGAAGGMLAFSAKRWGETHDTPLEPDPRSGRSVLVPAVRFDNLHWVPMVHGGTADLSRYPIAERHEDFVMLVEAPDRDFGWAAALRADSHDLVLSLKHPQEMPVTMLWFSNGGRDLKPWNGRHRNVLGIEEGCCNGARGHRAAIIPSPLTAAGVPTALTLEPDGSVAVRHVIGGLAVPQGWHVVQEVEPGPGILRITGDDGAIEVPFDSDFLKGGAPWQK